MNGFCFVLNGNSIGTEKLEQSDRKAGNNYFCEYKMLDKFQKDKLYFDNKKHFVLLDGIVFNKMDLIKGYGGKSEWKDVYEDLIKVYKYEVMNQLRGSFCGLIYNHEKDEGIAFTNHSGEKAVFYYAKNGLLIIASHMEIMHDMLLKNDQKIEVDLQSCNEMLVTGSLLHGNTIIKNVRRITAGKYIKFNGRDLFEERYHMFRNIPEHNLSLEECIDKADALFRQAVDRIFAKNQEYGYKAEADLSGGLDSRLATWVAHDLGYCNILNVCYCQTGKLDHIASKRIAKSLDNEYYFYPMDGGSFLTDVDVMTQKTGGQILYSLCTGANRAFDNLNLDKIGLAVTGLLGEIHNGYWTQGMEHTEPHYTEVRYTNTVELNVPKEYEEDYDNYEQMNLYEFSIPLFLSSVFARQDRCEVYSPFIDKDFLEFAYRIPLKLRKNYYFTQNWILKKYPEAAKFVWQTKMKPIDKAYKNQIYIPQILWNIEDYILRIYNKICRILKINSQKALKGEMNPFQAWYESNSKLKEFFNDYYKNNKDIVTNLELKDKMEKMFCGKICSDKILVVNLLAILKEYQL